MCFAPQRCAFFPHRNLQKWSEPLVFLNVFNMLTWKCASRHNGVHFFDISTSKSGPELVCFVHFHFEICFAPQRRALFRHLNLQKWSERGVFCRFWLGNVLRATTACTFSTSQLPKVLRDPGVLYILTCKCASRHNGVQFFISHLASWLRTRRFSEPTFRPSGAPNHWKNTVFCDFPTFSRICIFFLLTLSLLLFFLLIFLFSLPLPCSAFHLSILSEVWLRNFLRIWIKNGRWAILNSDSFLTGRPGSYKSIHWRSQNKLGDGRMMDHGNCNCQIGYTMYLMSIASVLHLYPLAMTNIAIENHHL